nr:retrovirus-related Pol polyprotein from transposon TNT 1-94 [Tanacetum cinerariifolium]
MIGALMYLTSSRPDIVHAICLCARYQAKPTEKHLKEVKRIFCYLRETVNTCLWYTKDSGFELTGFSEADYAGCKDTFKSTSGGAQFLGEKLVSWSSKKQDCTVLSTVEAEYVSLFACSAQVLWMRTQLMDYGFHFNKIPIYCDSKSAIAISCNPVQHSRTKHIAVRYHFIKEHVEKGTIELYFVKTDYQLADLFTNALLADRFIYLVRRLGMRSLSPQELDRLAKSLVILFSIHSDEWKSFQSQHQTALRFSRRRYILIPAKSRFKTPCSIVKDKYMMKAQVHVSKSSAISDVQALPQKGTLSTRLPNNTFMSNKMLREIVSELSRSLSMRVVTQDRKATDDELTEKELKQIEANNQAIQTILLGLSEDIYAAVDSCETAQEIWLRVQQMMKGSDIGIQEKKAKLFNEWERFTSNDGESIESYYHRFLKLMNDLKQNKHFPEKIASNLKFLNNLQPEWSRHVTIVHQTKDLHITDYTQLYDFLKYNQNENYMQQPMPNPKDITNPTTVMNMALALMAKAFKLNYLTPTNNNQRILSNPRNRQIAQPGMNMGQDRQMQMVRGNGENKFRQYARQNVGNLNGLIGVPRNANHNLNGNGNLAAACVEGNATGHNGNQIRCYNCRGVGHFTRNCIVRPRRRDVAYLQTQLLIAQKEEAGIQLQAEEFDLMVAAADLDEVEEVNANCILMANLQQASTSGTQADKALVYDPDGSAEVHNYKDCYDNDIFNMFTQEEQYTELLELISESHQVPQNDNNVISEVTSMEQSGRTVEQHPANVEETRVLYYSLYQNLAIEVEKVNTKMALGYQNPFYLKQAQKKQQSLYDGKVLFEKHDPPVVNDSEETLQ